MEVHSMPRLIDLKGKRFGELKVIKRYHENDKYNKPQWLCRCSCGKEVVVLGNNLRLGYSKSCGCVTRQRVIESLTTHGFSIGGKAQRFYRIWAGMIQRCNNPNHSAYLDYGGRGIDVCESWFNFETFKNDMHDDYLNHVKENGEKNTSIDRIDNNKGYSPDNCQWTTQNKQVINTRRRKDNKSNHVGVSECKNGTWEAFISRNGVRYSKNFTNLDDAIQWRKAKEKELGSEGDKNRLPKIL